MNDLDKKLEEKLEDISKKVYETSPELQKIIDKVSNGEISESEAMELMLGVASADANLNTALTKFASEAAQEVESELRMTNPGIFQAPSGLPKLDPMWEARLYERIQFDDDAPELRVGPLPPGVSPAVPVAEAPADPVALGATLKNASEQMDAEIKQLLETGTSEESSTALTQHGFANLPQPSGYQPGQLPALINVATPTGAELSIMPLPQQQELAWNSAVTTQGRRSAAETIKKRVVENLSDYGFNIQSRKMDNSKDDILMKSVWTFSILGTGAESTQTRFSPITNASAYFFQEIVNHFTVENGMTDISIPVWFEITTVDLIDERRVGWAILIRSR